MKFIIRPLRGGPDAFAKARPRPENAFDQKDPSPIIDVSDDPLAVALTPRHVGDMIRFWHVPAGTLQGNFLLGEGDCAYGSFLINVVGVDQLRLTATHNDDLIVAPIIYEDYIERGDPLAMTGEADMQLTPSPVIRMQGESDFRIKALASIRMGGEGDWTAIMPRSLQATGESDGNIIPSSQLQAGGESGWSAISSSQLQAVGESGWTAISSSQATWGSESNFQASYLYAFAQWEYQLFDYVNIGGNADIWEMADSQGLVSDNLDASVAGTYNGDPQRVAPIQDDEAGSADLDGSGDYLVTGDVRDVGSSDDLVITAVIQTSTTGLYSFVSKYDSGSDVGYAFQVNSSGYLEGYLSDGTDSVTATGSTNVADGSPHYVSLVLYRAKGRLYLYLDGAMEANIDASTVLGVSNSQDLQIGYENNYFPGIISCVGVTNDFWADPATIRLASAAFNDRTFAQETPFRADLPSYVANTDFYHWWSAAYHFRHVDSEKVAQFTDYKHTSRAAVQSDSNKRPLVIGSSSINNNIDRLTFSGSEYFDHIASSADMTNYLVGGAFVVPNNTPETRYLMGYSDDSGQEWRLFVTPDHNYKLVFVSAGGNSIDLTISGSASTAAVVTYKWNPNDYRIRLTKRDVSGQTAKDAQFGSSQTLSSTFSTSQHLFANPSGNEAFEGDCYEGPSEAYRDENPVALRDEIWNFWN